MRPLIDDEHLVAESERFVHPVCGDQKCFASITIYAVKKQIDHLVGSYWIEGTRRFVENQHARISN